MTSSKSITEVIAAARDAQQPDHQADLGSTSGQSPGTEQKLAALAPVLHRVRRTDHWLVEPGKAPSRRRAPLTDELFFGHLDGTHKIGACPMQRGSSATRVALFDLDSHRGETPWPEMLFKARALIATARERGIRFVPFKSSGGAGLHLYALWAAEQDARSVRAAMSDILAAHGLNNGTRGVAAGQVEIFPKADAIPADGHGSMFVIPGAGKSVPLDRVTLAPIAWTAVEWPTSEPVKFVEPPPPVERIEYEAPELSRVQSALDAVDPNALDYDAWLRLLFAVNDATDGSAAGLAMFVAWCSRWTGFDAHASHEHTVKNWNAARTKPGGVTAGTLFHAARLAGWVDPSETSAEGFENLNAADAQRLYGDYLAGDWTDEDVALMSEGALAELETLSPEAAREARGVIERAKASAATQAAEESR